MKNILTLFRAEASESLNPRRFVERRSKSKGTPATLLFGILIVLLSFVAAGFYAYSFGRMANEVGAPELELLIFIIVDAVLTLITAATTGASRMFKATNIEGLIAMPLTGFQIYTGKLCAFLAENYLYSAMILIPAFGVYAYFASPPLLFIVAAIVLFIFVPMIPVGLGLLISTLFSRFKLGAKTKMIRNTIGVAAFIAVYILFLSSSSGLTQRLLANPSGFIAGAGKYFPPLKWCMEGAQLNWSSLLLFAAVSVAFIALVAWVASMRFSHSVGNVNASPAAKNEGFSNAKAQSPFFALFRKEASGYFSSFSYFMNTAFAPILLIAGAIYAAISISGNASSEFASVDASSIIAPLALVIVFFVISMSSTTAAAISIEGRRLQQLKAMPIKPKDIFKAKIVLNLLICGLPVLAASAVVVATGVLEPLDWAIILAAAVFYLLFISAMGLLINLRHPKLEWTNENAVVKQSASVMLTIGLGFIFCAVTGALLYLFVFKFELGVQAFLLAGAGLAAVAAVVAMLLLKKNGAKLYNAL